MCHVSKWLEAHKLEGLEAIRLIGGEAWKLKIY
jgi:hypothetical protein